MKLSRMDVKKTVSRRLRVSPSWQIFSFKAYSKFMYARAFLIRQPVSCENHFFFVVGSGRSGNTLLRRLMVETLDVYIPAETYVLGECIKSFLASGSLSWDQRVNLVLANFQFHPEFETMSQQSFAKLADDCKTLPRSERSVGAIIFKAFSFMATDLSQHTLLGDKTPLNTFSLGLLLGAFPNAKFLFLVRHPYDVVGSYLKMGRYINVQDAAKRWSDAFHAWREFSKSQKVQTKMEISYEMLVSNPTKIVEGVGDWLGAKKRQAPLSEDFFWGDIDARSHHLNVKSSVNQQSVGKGHDFLSEDQKSIVWKIAGEAASVYGYEP